MRWVETHRPHSCRRADSHVAEQPDVGDALRAIALVPLRPLLGCEWSILDLDRDPRPSSKIARTSATREPSASVRRSSATSALGIAHVSSERSELYPRGGRAIQAGARGIRSQVLIPSRPRTRDTVVIVCVEHPTTGHVRVARVAGRCAVAVPSSSSTRAPPPRGAAKTNRRSPS